jgi:hypothetical protein
MQRFWLISLLLLSSFFAHGEQKKVLGNWDVHYIVVNSTFFDPSVLKQYALQRSKYNAIINISALDSRTTEAQDIAVSGTYQDLLGRKKELGFKQIKEGDAIYYLAQFRFDDMDTYRFEVKLQSGNRTETLKFQQKLYVD